jgi:hypothetical protein
LSEAGKKRYSELSGKKFTRNVRYDDPYLVQTVRELKEAANANIHVDLRVITVRTQSAIPAKSTDSLYGSATICTIM